MMMNSTDLYFGYDCIFYAQKATENLVHENQILTGTLCFAVFLILVGLYSQHKLKRKLSEAKKP